MIVDGQHYRTIWINEDDETVAQIIDQRSLPHEFVIEDLYTVDEVAIAIKDMHVRGAGLIGAAAGYGMYLAALEAPEENFDAHLVAAGNLLKSMRPTAMNLEWAVERQLNNILSKESTSEKILATFETAKEIADEDAEYCRRIGWHGSNIIEMISKNKDSRTVNILTHCNAGWLAFVDYGSATAPIYAAHDEGIDVHVWVDETRPRNQGARLTAWELNQHGVSHTVIPDNVGGHLMQHGLVDLVLVGSDRTTRTGDVGNKIGTYLKALAAKDNNVPFYAALPSSTFDWKAIDGVRDIPIEQRDSTEVEYVRGWDGESIIGVRITPESSPVANYGFDVTPARLVTGLITERGICNADEHSITTLFPHKAERSQNE